CSPPPPAGLGAAGAAAFPRTVMARAVDLTRFPRQDSGGALPSMVTSTTEEILDETARWPSGSGRRRPGCGGWHCGGDGARTGGVSSSPSPTRTASSSPSPSQSPSPSASTSPQPAGAAPALHVSGNKLVTSTGATYRLLGVNRSGGEFACIQGNGMWNGPMDQTSITAIRTWKVRAVRVPLNEECWLGTSDVPSTGASGATYQQNVMNYVNLPVQNR